MTTTKDPFHKPSKFDPLLRLAMELRALDNIGVEIPWGLADSGEPFVTIIWGNHPEKLRGEIRADLLALPAVAGLHGFHYEPVIGCYTGEIELRSMDDADLLSVVEVFERHITLCHDQFTDEFISDLLGKAGLTRLPRG